MSDADVVDKPPNFKAFRIFCRQAVGCTGGRTMLPDEVVADAADAADAGVSDGFRGGRHAPWLHPPTDPLQSPHGIVSKSESDWKRMGI